MDGVPDNCDCNDNGVPDDEDIATCPAMDLSCQDCNNNGLPDGDCDLGPGGGSVDDDLNGVPDECDPLDCDGNGANDAYDIANCTGDPACDDCNMNDVPDVCDVDPADPDGDGEVSTDLNGNVVPDECEVQAPLLAAPPHDMEENRYGSVDMLTPNPGLTIFDLKVTLTSTQVNGVMAVGSSWWATDPIRTWPGSPSSAATECITILSSTRPPSPPDWTDFLATHVTGCPMMPTSEYDFVIVIGPTELAPLSVQTQALPTGSPRQVLG